MSIHSDGLGRRPGSAQRVIFLAAAITLGIAVYACDRAASPTSPRERPGVSPSVAVTPGVTTLCKVGPGATFQVRVGVNAAPQTVTVNGGSCADVATVNPAAQDDVIVSIAEDSAPYYALDHIVLDHGSDAPQTITGTNAVSFEAAHGAIVTFHNNAVVSVCKVGTSATFQYQVGLGDSFHPLSLADGECSTLATLAPPAADDVIVTVNENTSSTYQLDHISLGLGALPAQTITATTKVSFEAAHGARATFFNVPVTSSLVGCTFTQGYYKNKGKGLLPAGDFFLSGQTWLAVLETAPKQGNGYYILAHQYIAAVINANSASVPASVSAAITAATSYFGKATPGNWIADGSYSKDQLTAWADLLDSYNSGKVGPGHCD